VKKTSLLLVLATLTFAGCGSDDGAEPKKRTDVEVLEAASSKSDEASARSAEAIAALREGDIEEASARIAEAEELANAGRDELSDVQSLPVRAVFTKITDLTIEGYKVLERGIEAAGRGDEAATERYVKRSLAIRARKLRLFNTIDFASVGIGESNEKVREALRQQLESAAGQ
jgi:hypothetical protein